MNKPAPKEPSMDEILSSIRQIIADDDAAVAPSKPSAPMAAANVPPAPRPFPTATTKPAPREPEAAAPLALSPDQIVTDDAEPVAPLNFDDMPVGDDAAEIEAEAALIDPEDIAFESDDEVEMTSFSVALEEPEAPSPRQAPPARAATAPAAAKPLLQPATDAAVKQSFAKLSGMSMVASGVTLDAMLREMLRPMLKEWLDENLSGVVERMVEKEISRLSRGD